MSKNLRSSLIVLSLVFMLLGGILIPDTAQARDENTTQQTKSIAWKASRENAAQFQAIVEEMGIPVKVADVRNTKGLQIPSDVQLSDRQVSADKLAKLVETNINRDDMQRSRIHIHIEINIDRYDFQDGSVLIVIEITITITVVE